jgi:hypothetical protein
MRKKLVKFEQYKIPGYQCDCGQKYYESKQAQEILINNQTKRSYAN